MGSTAVETRTAARTTFGVTDVGLVVMAVIWGINYSVVKAGLRTLEPLTFNGLRVLLAALVLTGIALSVRSTSAETPPLSRRDIGALLLLGFLGNGLYQLLFILGLARTQAGIAAVVAASSPAWMALIARMLGRERVPLRGWLGIALQLLGVASVVGSTSRLDAGGSSLVGAGLIAVASITWALFSVLLQPFTQRAHPLHLSAITMGSGATFLVALASPGLVRLQWRAIDAGEWFAVLYAGLLALVVAYLLYYRGVRVLGPTKTAMYSNLQPLIALAFAWVALHEQPTVWQLAGAALVMTGLLVSRTARIGPAPSVTTANATADAPRQNVRGHASAEIPEPVPANPSSSRPYVSTRS